MFEFIKYIHPGNYFNLIRSMPQAVFSHPLPNVNRVGYSNVLAEQMDLAYRYLISGLIPDCKSSRNPIQDKNIFNTEDNYIFIHRYFSRPQCYYVLFIRLCLLNNPVSELIAFFRGAKFKVLKIKPLVYDDFYTFQSVLIESNPLVSVIIPTLNRYNYLECVLSNLEKQNYPNFEVIICDQSEPFNDVFYNGWNLDIKVIKQKEKSLWLARNNSIKNAGGEFIALTEDDVEIPVDWISNHLKCLDFFNADASAGVFYKKDGLININSRPIATFKYSQQFPTGNAMLKKVVFQSVGMFDRQFEKQRMGDGEFGLRALQGGFRVVSNPMAFIIDVKAPTGGLRQLGSWDAWRPTSFFAPRPIPSVLYLMRKYFSSYEVVLFLIKNIPQSYIPYRWKYNKSAKIIVLFTFPIWLPIALVGARKSWNLSSQKLKQGSLIETLC